MEDDGFTVVSRKRKEKPQQQQPKRGGNAKPTSSVTEKPSNNRAQNSSPAPAAAPASSDPKSGPPKANNKRNKRANNKAQNQGSAQGPEQPEHKSSPVNVADAELVQSFRPINAVPAASPAKLWEEINAFDTAEFSFLRGEPSDAENARLISIYDDFQTFRLLPRSAEELQIPYLYFSSRPPWRPHPTDPQVYPSVTNKKEFLERFAIFTENQFDGWTEWENMVVVGGAVVASLLPIPPSYQDRIKDYYHRHAFATSDIDIYFYGLTIEEFSQKTYKFYKYLCSKNSSVLVIRTPYTITFATKYPQRHIQIVIGQWNNIEQILFEPDVGVSCVAYDGTRVLTTPRGRFGYNHRCIIASPHRYSVRGFPEYESRLIKYSKRGFAIWDEKLDWSKVSGYFVKIAKGRLMEHNTAEGRADISGLRLLITLHTYRKELAKVDILGPKTGEQKDKKHVFKNEGLPYGPNWSTEKLRSHIAKGVFCRSHYGPYKLDEPMTLIDSIGNHESILNPHRDKLVKLDNHTDWRYKKSWYSRTFESERVKELAELVDDYDY